MANSYRITKSVTSLMKYHMVFCSRYRRKIFLVENVEKRFKETVQKVCNKMKIEIISIDCGVDYVHLVLECPPTLAPSDIIFHIKLQTGRMILSEFDKLKRMQSAWTKNYLISTEDVLAQETIDTFVNAQDKNLKKV